MPLLTRSQIAEICGITKSKSAYVSKYVKRGQLIETKENGKYVYDTTDSTNFNFLKRMANGNPNVLALVNKLNGKGRIPKNLNLWDKPLNDKSKKNDSPGQSSVDGFYANSIKDVKDIYDAKAKQARLRLLEIEERKLLGKMVPTEMATETLAIFSATMQKVFLQESKRWIMDVSHRNKLDEVEQGGLRNEMINIVNLCFKKSINLSKKKLKDVIDDIMSNGEYDKIDDDGE